LNLDFLKGKKILVTGGAGLLGTSITQHLASLGKPVQSTFFSRLPPEHLKKYYKQYDFTKFEECLVATKGQDYVIICAVQASGVSGIRQSPTSTILPNLEIHAGLFEACCQNGVEKAVWVSSSSVYQEAFHPIREDQLDLNKPPYELYQGIGWVYRYLEQLAQCYCQKRGLQIGVIRTSNIYGPYDRFDDEKSHVIPALIKRAMDKEDPFVVWGNGNTIRDFVYVDDLVDGVLRVLNGYCIAEPINISYGTPVSVNELVKVILGICDHHVPPQYDQTKPTAVPYRVLDNTKAENLFGKIEKTPLQEGIQKTVDWYTSDLSRD
jgi:GDP-L-fucose synthase